MWHQINQVQYYRQNQFFTNAGQALVAQQQSQREVNQKRILRLMRLRQLLVPVNPTN